MNLNEILNTDEPSTTQVSPPRRATDRFETDWINNWGWSAKQWARTHQVCWFSHNGNLYHLPENRDYSPIFMGPMLPDGAVAAANSASNRVARQRHATDKDIHTGTQTGEKEGIPWHNRTRGEKLRSCAEYRRIVREMQQVFDENMQLVDGHFANKVVSPAKGRAVQRVYDYLGQFNGAIINLWQPVTRLEYMVNYETATNWDSKVEVPKQVELAEYVKNALPNGEAGSFELGQVRTAIADLLRVLDLGTDDRVA